LGGDRLRGSTRAYEECHKTIDGILYKLCSDCNQWLPLTEEYFYKNKSAQDGFNPYCKEDTIKRSSKRQKDNPERIKEYTKEIYKRKPQYFKDKYNRWLQDNEERAKELQREWQHNNPEKVKGYNEDRKLHKKHKISKKEWGSSAE
jgi:hypothetical protein